MPVAAAQEGQPPEPLEGSAAELRLLWEWDRQQDAARESAWHEGRCRIRDAQLAAEQAGRRMAAAEAAQTAGALAQQIALQYRDRVARLILAGTCSGISMVPHDWSGESLMRTLNPFAAVVEDLMSDMAGSHLDTLIWPSMTSMASQFASFAGWSSLAFLPLIASPTLVLAGTRDRIVPPANALQLAAFIPGAVHHILPDAGHLFPFTEPERTASHISRFFERETVRA